MYTEKNWKVRLTADLENSKGVPLTPTLHQKKKPLDIKRIFQFFSVYSLSILLSLCSNSPLSAEKPSLTVIEDRAEIPILTPDLAERQVRKIRLDNALEAYLISDPRARESAAAMSVEVGAFQDPQGSLGMAHFLEHMLFLGTTKYPDESSYDRFMSAHGGTRNAYTANDHTNYMFSIGHEAFDEAIDRFSDFFKDPLFNPSGVDREMQAVDQEHAKNVELDSYRSYHVNKVIGNSRHPHSRFRTGNLETLSQISRESLMQFYREHYSANLMHLVIYSNRSLDELQALVQEKFSPIKNTNKGIFETEEPMLAKTYTGHMAIITPVKDVRTLTLSWEFPATFAQMKDNNPSDSIAYILGHEGEESLLAQLKRENLAEGLQSGGFADGKSNFTFSLHVSLTQEGVIERERVIERIFQAIARLQETGVPKSLFKEAKQTAITRYQFQHRESPYHMVMNYARGLIHEDLATFPEWSEIPQRYDAEAIQAFLSLMTVDRCYFQLLAHPELTGLRTDRSEKWTGAEFAIRPISDERLSSWKAVSPHEHITVPRPNPLLPENLQLKAEIIALDQVPVPSSIVDDDFASIYFTPDRYYGVPEVTWIFEIRTPAINPQKAETMVLADLYVKAVQEALNAYSYYALMAGLRYELAPTEGGLQVKVSGYNDKAQRLFQEILKTLVAVEPTEEQCVTYLNALVRDYENIERSGPLRKATETLRTVLYSHYIPSTTKAKQARYLNRERLIAFRDSLFDRSYTTGLLFGNMVEQEVKDLWQEMRKILGSKVYDKKEHYKRATVALPKHHGPYYINESTRQQGNALLLMVQGGPADLHNRAIHDMLASSLEQPFYTQLRTKQQTGYIVFNYNNDIERQLFAFFGIQSNSHDCRDLLARFELSIESFLQELGKEGFDEARFEVIRQSWITRLRQYPKNITEMAELLNTLAFEYDGDFERMEKRLQSFQNVSFEDFVKVVRETHGQKNKQRVAVLITGETPADTLSYSPMRSASQVRKISDYLNKEQALEMGFAPKTPPGEHVPLDP